MNAYTRQDLSVMQAWPLDRKIRVTQAKIIEWYHHYGGKVAVFRAARTAPFCWTLPGGVPRHSRRVCGHGAGIPGDTGVCQNRSQCNVAAA